MKTKINPGAWGAGADVEAEKASGDGDGFSFAILAQKPVPDPYCGRCNGPAGPEGAWCDNCIQECKEYTLWLDQRDKREVA